MLWAVKFSACTLVLAVLLILKNTGSRDDEDWNHGTEFSENALDFSDMTSTLGMMSASAASNVVTKRLTQSLEDRITTLFSKATTAECRAKIATHFSHFVDALGQERSFPFLESHFQNTCPEPVYDFEKLPRGISIEDIMNRTYQPPRHLAHYIDDPNDLRILYGILTHEHPQSTIRLIEALYEEGHSFVIHVDGKRSSDDTYRTIVEYAKDRPYVHVLPDRYRIRVNWGGFSLVNATYVFKVMLSSCMNYSHQRLSFTSFS